MVITRNSMYRDLQLVKFYHTLGNILIEWFPLSCFKMARRLCHDKL